MAKLILSLKRERILIIWIEYDKEDKMGIEIWNAGEKVVMKALKEIKEITKAGEKAIT